MDGQKNSSDLYGRGDVLKLILPLIIEQVLAISIGLADTMMVSSVSEEAMSAVSVVDSINILLINIFSALATGGTIIIARHLGSGENKLANKAAGQLFIAVFALSAIVAAGAVISNEHLLRFVYGNLEEDVMTNCVKYFFWSALSYPFLALYNAGAAILRSENRSKVTMYVSIGSNVINVAGNAVLIYGFSLGVTGAAVASLVSRAAGAAASILLVSKGKIGPVRINGIRDFIPDLSMIRRILRIGVPTGLENGMFQVGKILVQRIVTLGGTVSMAANSATSSLANMLLIPASAIGLGLITISGQCLGAGRVEEAKMHTKKLVINAYVMTGVLSATLLLTQKWIFMVYNLSEQTTNLASVLITSYAIASSVLWPISFVLPNTLRAAGDVSFTMRVSMLSMWIFRIGFSYFFYYVLGLGTLSVWLAMYCDWIVRVSFFIPRISGDKWLKHKV